MGESRKEIKVFNVEYICDVCTAGKLRPVSNTVLTSNPPKYEHECPVCKKQYVFTEVYPKTVYEEIQETVI